MIRRFMFLLLLIHSSRGLFEDCDESFELNDDNSVTINSKLSFVKKNISSCRFVITAPNDFIVDVTCKLRMDQLESSKCPMKRFFISTEGIRELHGAEYFCNRNGSFRIVKRQSAMNRIVLAYVTQTSVSSSSDKFLCTAKRIQSTCDCGWSRKTRVVGGKNAELHEFPSMIALLALSLNKVFCGGVIISARWGLTGAHCFNEPFYANLSNVVAYVGEHNIKIDNETTYTEIHEIEKFIRHENYSIQSYEQNFDIALMKFKTRVSFNRAVGPACLPWGFGENSFDNEYATISGFGYLTFNGPASDVLQKVSLQVLPSKKCQDSLTNSRKMCTYAADKDSCISDSGGPLYISRSRQILIGLVSYGILCGTQTPSVNTRLSSYLSWIESNTEGAQFCRKKV